MPEFTAPGLGREINVSIDVEVPENANGVLYALQRQILRRAALGGRTGLGP